MGPIATPLSHPSCLRRLRLGLRWALPLALLAPLLLSAPTPPAIRAAEELTDQATLEARQPEVRLSPSGATDWRTVPARETVRVGDRVQTGAGAAARLVYFEGSVTEISADTSLVIQRLDRGPANGLRTLIFQSVGTTVSRVVHLVDPGAGFDVETPASVVMVRGTTPRVQVAPNGTSRVGNIPDGTQSTVIVQGKDAARTVVRLAPGQETQVIPGQPPTPPTAIGGSQASTGTPPSTQSGGSPSGGSPSGGSPSGGSPSGGTPGGGLPPTPTGGGEGRPPGGGQGGCDPRGSRGGDCGTPGGGQGGCTPRGTSGCGTPSDGQGGQGGCGTTTGRGSVSQGGCGTPGGGQTGPGGCGRGGCGPQGGHGGDGQQGGGQQGSGSPTNGGTSKPGGAGGGHGGGGSPLR